ncbi:alkylation response protein AidB-like acyl-CoA dehydrogenase [Bradyrhizobium japonicum]
MSPSVQLAVKPSATPTVAEFHARLDALLPLVESRAAEAEAQGYLTDDVVAALRKAGIYTMLFPKEVGGAELLPYDAMTVIERLAYAHASAGWCVIGNNMEGTTLAIYIEDEGIKKVFAGGPDITIAGNGVPRGFARPVDGGYMIRGNWAYGSGIQHAEWVHSGCFVTDASGKDMVFGPNGQPKIVVTHHPRATIKLMGNWDVLGLRATGSFDYTLSEGDELFVPTHMTYDFDIDAPRRGGVQGCTGAGRLQRLGAFRLGRRCRPPHARRTRQGDRPAPGSIRQVARQRELQVPVRAGRSSFPRSTCVGPRNLEGRLGDLCRR